MRNLDRIATRLVKVFDALDAAREEALARSREVVRHSGSAIKAAHRKEDPAPFLAEAEKAAARLRRAVAGRPTLEAAGFTEMAFQELAEAHLVAAVAAGKPLPPPERIGVPPGPYVLGLGDLVGELRRFTLDAMVEGDVAGARRRLDQMEDLYMVLMRFDYPSALVDVRRKQDAARGMLERTRGEVAVAVRGRRMEEKIDRLTDMLDELEDEEPGKPRKKRAAPKAPRRDDDDVPDVDRVW